MDVPTAIESKEIVKFFVSNQAAEHSEVFSAYIRFYQGETSAQSPHNLFIASEDAVLKSHLHIREMVKKLWDEPSITREIFEKILRHNSNCSDVFVPNAIRTIVRVGFMLDCVVPETREGHSTQGYNPQSWRSDAPFSGFLSSVLPAQHAATANAYEHSGRITAWKLKKRCKVRFEKTDNIGDHLLYDPKTRVLKIFHQMAYLRAHLQRYPAPITKMSIEDSLNKGTLPSQLLLETLETFYELLFPLSVDKRSRSERLLHKLIKKKGFDPQANADIQRHVDWIPGKEFRFLYWGRRLEILAHLARKPPPTTGWMYWMERHTGNPRNALTIAIIGLFLSALFGFLGVVVGIVQIVLSYEAWKWPVGL